MLQLSDLGVLGPQLCSRVFDALQQLLLQFLESLLVCLESHNLGLNLLNLPLARRLEQGNIFSLLSDLLLKLLACLLQPFDLFDDNFLVRLAQLALKTVVLFQLNWLRAGCLPEGSRS